MWYGERINNKKNTRKPKFALCCGQGQVQLPLLKDSPATLKQLLYGNDKKSIYFRDNIRQLNMVFSFTSLGGKCDRSVPKGCGPLKMFVLQGENYHLMGSLKPPPGNTAKFGQLYIVDTENEVTNRASIIGYNVSLYLIDFHLMSKGWYITDCVIVFAGSTRQLQKHLKRRQFGNKLLSLY